MKLAGGKYIAFCDNDDAMAPHLLQYAVCTAEQHPEEVIVWDLETEWDKFCESFECPIGLRSCDEFQAMILFSNKGIEVQPWNKLYDGKTIRQGQLQFDERLGHIEQMGEDLDFLKRYYECFFQNRAKKFVFIEVPLHYNERKNENSQTVQYHKQHQEISVLQAPQKGYWGAITKEFVQNLRESPDFFQNESAGKDATAHYIATFLYGIYSAQTLKERLPRGWQKGEAVRNLLKLGKKYKRFPLECFLLQTKQAFWISEIYKMKSKNSIWYYRLEWLAQHLLPGWK